LSWQPKLSVVIRVRNEAAFLEKTLAALELQNYKNPEFIVVDNESTDGSREIAERFGAKIVSIAKEEFSYGRASNRGFRAAAGEVVVLLSAHSLPIGPDFLSNAVKPFTDPSVAAVRLLHVGNRAELESWMEACHVLTQGVGLDHIIRAGPLGSACAIRRSVWETILFDEYMSSVEDKFWAVAVVEKGFVIAKAPAVYLYMRDRHLMEHVRIMTRDRLEYFSQTGTPFEGGPRLSNLLRTIFLAAPKLALRTVVQETLLYCSLKTIPWKARLKGTRAASGVLLPLNSPSGRSNHPERPRPSTPSHKVRNR
jgi:glycosyltransferase involved in cell wall biosynthesis